MKNYHHLITLLSIILMIYSCSNKVEIEEYSNKLNIDFPSDMKLISYENQSEFQDYSIYSVYKLSFNQKNAFQDEIIDNICNENHDSSDNKCWKRCDDFYTYEYKNEDEGILIKLIFIADNDIRHLIINEVKL